MHRKLAFVVASSVIASPAYALGLGNLTVKSALNQPLSAEIEVRASEPGELSNIAIKLAPQADFERAGLDRTGLLNKLRFIVVTKPDGQSVIRISTVEPVPEPYLDFLIEVNWSKGRLLREYTVLLDPPVAMTSTRPAPTMAAKATPAPTMSKPQPKSITKPVYRSSPATTNTPSASMKPSLAPQESEGESSYGPVKSSDTLWKIAQQVKPNESVTTHQTMIALFRQNPDAFIGENINRLKRGYVLRVPEASKIAAVSHAEAVAITRQQTQAWKSGGTPVVASKPMETSDGELKIIAPDKSSKASSTAAMGADGQAAGGGTKELALVKETLAAKERERQEAEKRVELLEQRLNDTERLLALRDEELKKLQGAKGEETSEKMPMPEETAKTEEKMPEPMKPAEEKPVEAKTPEKPVVTPPVAKTPEPAKPAVTPKPAVKPKPQPEPMAEPPIWEQLLQNIPLLGGIVFGVIAIIALVVVALRRKRDDEYDDDEITGVADAYEEAHGFDEEESESEDNTVLAAFDDAGDDAPMLADEPRAADEADDELMQEIDLYIAHQRFEPAVGLIKDVLVDQPERDDLRLKLLEIFSQQSDKEDEFVAVAQELHDNIGDENDPSWKEVVNLGKQVAPNAALFGGDGSASAPVAHDAADSTDEELVFEFDLGDLDDSAAEEPQEAESEEAHEVADEAEVVSDELPAFDADLELDLAEATSAAEQLETTDVVADDADEAEEEFDGLEFNMEPSEDDELDQAISDLSEEMEKVDQDYAVDSAPEKAEADEGVTLDFTSEEDHSDESFQLDEGDEVGTKLDLAKAYIDMGDDDGARSLLEEVEREGDEGQQAEAREMLKQL